jgi:hypothetical protein
MKRVSPSEPRTYRTVETEYQSHFFGQLRKEECTDRKYSSSNNHRFVFRT